MFILYHLIDKLLFKSIDKEIKYGEKETSIVLNQWFFQA